MLSLNLKPWGSSQSDPSTDVLNKLAVLVNPFPFPFHVLAVSFNEFKPSIEIEYELKHNPVATSGIIAIIAGITIIVAIAGYVIVSWSNTKIISGEQTQELYEYIPEFAEQLTQAGFTPDQIAEIMASLTVKTNDWFKIASLAIAAIAGAYIVGELIKR